MFHLLWKGKIDKEDRVPPSGNTLSPGGPKSLKHEQISELCGGEAFVKVYRKERWYAVCSPLLNLLNFI